MPLSLGSTIARKIYRRENPSSVPQTKPFEIELFTSRKRGPKLLRTISLIYWQGWLRFRKLESDSKNDANLISAVYQTS